MCTSECQKNAKIDMLPIKCILTGLPGVGKTSFLRRIEKKLAPQNFPDEVREVIPSTGFEHSVTVNISEEAVTSMHATIHPGGWFATKNLQDQAKFMFSAIKRPIATKSTHSSATSMKASYKGSSTAATKFDVTARKIANGVQKIFQKKATLKSARSLMKEAIHQQNADFSDHQDVLTTVCFMDTGGQPEFHELLPPLLHGSAFHMIFFNAFLDLFKSVKVIYRHQNPNLSSVEYETNSSSIEIIYQLLVSFFSISRKEKHQCVAALFGGHIDKYNVEIRQNELKDISEMLGRAFGNTSFFKEGFLFSASNEEFPYIFQPIDNITCAEEELGKVLDFLARVIRKKVHPS